MFLTRELIALVMSVCFATVAHSQEANSLKKETIEFESETVKGANYLGFTLGLPGAFNLVYWSQSAQGLGFRAHIGGLSSDRFSIVGAQIDITSTWKKTKHFLAGGYLGLGHFTFNDIYNDDERWTYLVAGQDIKIYGFFLNLGLSGGTGTFSNPQLMGSMGFLFTI